MNVLAWCIEHEALARILPSNHAARDNRAAGDLAWSRRILYYLYISLVFLKQPAVMRTRAIRAHAPNKKKKGKKLKENDHTHSLRSSDASDE